MQDILGGRIHAMVDAASGLAGAISGGSVKALAVASDQRLPTHRGLPILRAAYVRALRSCHQPSGATSAVASSGTTSMRFAASSPCER